MDPIASSRPIQSADGRNTMDPIKPNRPIHSVLGFPDIGKKTAPGTYFSGVSLAREHRITRSFLRSNVPVEIFCLFLYHVLLIVPLFLDFGAVIATGGVPSVVMFLDMAFVLCIFLSFASIVTFPLTLLRPLGIQSFMMVVYWTIHLVLFILLSLSRTFWWQNGNFNLNLYAVLMYFRMASVATWFTIHFLWHRIQKSPLTSELHSPLFLFGVGTIIFVAFDIPFFFVLPSIHVPSVVGVLVVETISWVVLVSVIVSEANFEWMCETSFQKTMDLLLLFGMWTHIVLMGLVSSDASFWWTGSNWVALLSAIFFAVRSAIVLFSVAVRFVVLMCTVVDAWSQAPMYPGKQ